MSLLHNDRASKVLPRLDMDGLLNDGICPTSKDLQVAGAMLMESRYGQGLEGRQSVFKELLSIVQTYQGELDVLVPACSPPLLSLASRLAPPEEYVMVHWRMESVPHDALSQRAYALINAFYLADIPVTCKSSSFKDFGNRHTEAVGILLEEGSDHLMAHSGVLGILDKVIGIKASVLLSAAQGCGRKSSSDY
ncbi:hypothetical protein EV421DRAFT_1901770 [Armillaria borealis]|uniref:Uncharacterized protein n=1 Tax=Armillaria borealis TaxID=47425 RepID=A0AA39MT35_9AGAR|nr:hypothetical protein EV421DRAFT_1901770 [Armillaria borealis]